MSSNSHALLYCFCEFSWARWTLSPSGISLSFKNIFMFFFLTFYFVFILYLLMAVRGSGWQAHLKSWLTVSNDYPSHQEGSLWDDISTRHHLTATSRKSMEQELLNAQSTTRIGRDKKWLLLLYATLFGVVIMEDVRTGAT